MDLVFMNAQSVQTKLALDVVKRVKQVHFWSTQQTVRLVQQVFIVFIHPLPAVFPKQQMHSVMRAFRILMGVSQKTGSVLSVIRDGSSHK
jgi:hypothetical protein